MEEKLQEEKKKGYVSLGITLSSMMSAEQSVEQAAKKFAKPDTYDRKLYDSGVSKREIKQSAFADGTKVRDPHSGKELELKKLDAKAKYGDHWQEHMAEADHITPLEKIFGANKNKPWLTNEDLKNIANDENNMQVVSRKFNNAKRSRTNEEFVRDEKYLNDKNIVLSEKAKEDAVRRGKESEAAIRKAVKKKSFHNMVDTGLEAGKSAGQYAGIMTATISGILNLNALIRGEKNVEEALADTAVDTGKGAFTGFVISGGLTVVSQSLSSATSPFIQALTEANVPAKVVTAVLVTGDVLKRYGQGEISTQECIIQLGECGVNFAAAGYSMAIGQALIPIPVVGAAIGALVGSVLASGLYNQCIQCLQKKELEHQERLRIIEESERAAEMAREFRKELESYLAEYFREYQDCFDEALSEIQCSVLEGDADGIIAGANQITRKLGGKVAYETTEEFKDFLLDDTVDIF